MTFFVFASKSDAEKTEHDIVGNVRGYLAQQVPDALSSDGRLLRGRNASTGELVDVYTERWAVPQQIADGRWVIPKPTQEKTAPIPVEVFVAGIDADESQYDPAWFASPLI